ncbi:sensor histidine kinase [Lentibacillus daqui]|uniref:sensor histidine kinase n=1 Tax=Lentibacillus daqui TaxID=2911514 RepID=UPI0022B182BA|nr:HAMP domain-containing sensor histidine kinase [Lentibacillus daqui]
MKLKNRVAFYFVSRLFWLIVIWGLLIGVSIILFSFFLRHDQTETSRLSIEAIANNTVIQNQEIDIHNSVKEDLQDNDIWLQVLDENGNEFFSFNKPREIQVHYSPGELVSDYIYPANNSYQLSTWFETINGQEVTWVTGKPITNNNPFFYWANNLWIVSIIVIGIIIAIYFGKQLGDPLLFVMEWIENLSKGNYEEPSNYLKLHSKNHKQNRGKHKVYKELIMALSNLTSNLKKSQVERERLEKTREEWMAGVSHDLKTPLSTIKGYTMLIASGEYNLRKEEVRRFAETMEERVAYMEQLIEDFSLTFQLKNGAIPIKFEEINLKHFIKDILEQMKKLPKASSQIFSLETSKEQILSDIDTKYLKRAFENLIANCIKHNPPKTKIKIILYEEAEKIHITIQDDGIGMNQETVSQLFDQYFRGTDSSSDNSGIGLGMAIAKQIILAHQGNIVVKSKMNIGTQFHIILPRRLKE